MSDRAAALLAEYGDAWREGVWDLLHAAHASRRRVLVCADAAFVEYDQRGREGPRPAGDFVGYVVAFDDESFWLAGWSFRTRIEWVKAGLAWYRDEAPDPCPRCGGTG